MDSPDKTVPLAPNQYNNTSGESDEPYYHFGSSSSKITSPFIFGSIDLICGAGLCAGSYFVNDESMYVAIILGGYGALSALFGALAFTSTKSLFSTSLVRFWRRASIFLSLVVLISLVLLHLSGVYIVPISFLCSDVRNCKVTEMVLAAALGVILFLYSICGFIATRSSLSKTNHRLQKSSARDSNDVHMDSIQIVEDGEEDQIDMPLPLSDTSPEAIEAKKIRTAISKFNAKPSRGISYLAESGLTDGSASSAAKFIKQTSNLHLDKIGDFLGDWPEFNKQVLEEYTSFFDFSGMTLDNAIRAFLSKFRLPGEAQKIDRIMERFARRYHQCNSHGDFSSDTAYILAFSLIMLNTDAHSPHIKRKMTKQEFLNNNRGIAGGRDLSPELMGDLYDRIVREEIKLHGDLMFAATVKKGYLKKRGRNGNFQKRYFALSNNCLFYFANVEDQDPRAMIPLEGLQLTKIDDTKTDGPQSAYGLCISDPLSDRVKSCKFVPGKAPAQTDHAAYRLYAETEEERDEWFNILQVNIVGHPFHTLIKNKKQNFGRRQTILPTASSGSIGGSVGVLQVPDSPLQ